MQNVIQDPCKKVGILHPKFARLMKDINSGFQDEVSYESGLFLVVLKKCFRRAHPIPVVVEYISASEIEKCFELFFGVQNFSGFLMIPNTNGMTKDTDYE